MEYARAKLGYLLHSQPPGASRGFLGPYRASCGLLGPPSVGRLRHVPVIYKKVCRLTAWGLGAGVGVRGA